MNKRQADSFGGFVTALFYVIDTLSRRAGKSSYCKLGKVVMINDICSVAALEGFRVDKNALVNIYKTMNNYKMLLF